MKRAKQPRTSLTEDDPEPVEGSEQQPCRTALVLLGHGSHISSETAGVVWEQADRLRQLGVADEVTAAFWKEEPSFRRALHSLQASDITLIPLFTTRGYFTATVIPAELSLGGALTRHEKQLLRYTEPIGGHPEISAIVRRRIDDLIRTEGLSHSDSAAVLIGHGTAQHADSRSATEAEAHRLHTSGRYGEVAAVFLDDRPSIPDVFQLTRASCLILVPYFLAGGSHVTRDVPRAIGLQEFQRKAVLQGRHVFYTAPVGSTEDLVPIILSLAREAGAPLHSPRAAGPWEGFPRRGRKTLAARVAASGETRFAELQLEPASVYPADNDPDRDRIETPQDLRHRVRESPFRPLLSASGLPGGWRVPLRSPGDVHSVVEIVYPGLAADWADHREGRFQWTSFEATVKRQTGQFGRLGELTLSARCGAVETICGKCLRHPTWHYGGSPPEALPCAEPCNWWMSRVLASESSESS